MCRSSAHLFQFVACEHMYVRTVATVCVCVFLKASVVDTQVGGILHSVLLCVSSVLVSSSLGRVDVCDMRNLL